jgi:hypothetical protein
MQLPGKGWLSVLGKQPRLQVLFEPTIWKAIRKRIGVCSGGRGLWGTFCFCWTAEVGFGGVPCGHSNEPRNYSNACWAIISVSLGR